MIGTLHDDIDVDGEIEWALVDTTMGESVTMSVYGPGSLICPFNCGTELAGYYSEIPGTVKQVRRDEIARHPIAPRE